MLEQARKHCTRQVFERLPATWQLPRHAELIDQFRAERQEDVLNDPAPLLPVVVRCAVRRCIVSVSLCHVLPSSPCASMVPWTILAPGQ